MVFKKNNPTTVRNHHVVKTCSKPRLLAHGVDKSPFAVISLSDSKSIAPVEIKVRLTIKYRAILLEVSSCQTADFNLLNT
jgi:hypothetical protein